MFQLIVRTNTYYVKVSGNKQRVPQKRGPRNHLPPFASGFAKPSLHYNKLITQALVRLADKKGTAQQICEKITQQHAYYRHCPNDWKKSVHHVISTRKKFFHLFGLNESGENIWGLNPIFEKVMIKKWVPKYMQMKYLSSQTISAPSPANQVIVNSQSLRPQSPIFVSSGKCELVNYEQLIPETNCDEEDEVRSPIGEPEFALEEPDDNTIQNLQTRSEQSVWEPDVTVSGIIFLST